MKYKTLSITYEASPIVMKFVFETLCSKYYCYTQICALDYWESMQDNQQKITDKIEFLDVDRVQDKNGYLSRFSSLIPKKREKTYGI